ncbi:hypothetical protein ROA7745_02954 [Roseovarius aestuarii]|uniref:Core-binding (CB) domain-containing protein n=1 Tax=Roseovarius aestuarii TaxID=475083 RepID=A0A1X7BUD4_9RHOB|nr:hypothetical protein ROA7745_02954 [Roseovarius aestuarii]
MQRRHVQTILAEKAETPTAASNLRKRLIQLMDFAITLDWRGDNPARATKPFRVGDEAPMVKNLKFSLPDTIIELIYIWKIGNRRLELQRQNSFSSVRMHSHQSSLDDYRLIAILSCC